METVRLRFIREEAKTKIVQVAIFGTAPMVCGKIYDAPAALVSDLMATGDWEPVQSKRAKAKAASVPVEAGEGDE